MDKETRYDIAGLIATSKVSLYIFVVKIAIYSILLVLSILAIIFYGTDMLVFIGGVVIACISAFLCSRAARNFAFSDYNSANGEIADVHKEVKVIPTTKIGGINPFGVRCYDQDAKNEIRLGLFIKNGEQVHSYFFNDGTEEHAEYYESKGEVIHIWGTHFPVKLEIGKDEWLCPICGEFNANEKKTCSRCNKKILK